jgi:hypothetical protein
MNQSESQVPNTGKHVHYHSQNDIQICTDCITLMRSAAEKCREWSEDSTSSVCKGGLGTSAFVCDSLARSMEACMQLMGVGTNEMIKASDKKKDCCS